MAYCMHTTTYAATDNNNITLSIKLPKSSKCAMQREKYSKLKKNNNGKKKKKKSVLVYDPTNLAFDAHFQPLTIKISK